MKGEADALTLDVSVINLHKTKYLSGQKKFIGRRL